MGPTNRMRLLGAAFIAILIVAGCGDDNPQSPKLSGAPPEFLAGIWEVIDTSLLCDYTPIYARIRKATFTDTICQGGPDFGIANAEEAWEMLIEYDNVVPGIWTPLDIEYCFGFISDEEINVTCLATASSTLEECDFTVRVNTRGELNGDNWTLLRTITRIEGRDCGHRKDDSTIYCNNYSTTLRRIGDGPEECETSNTVIGR